MVVNRQNTQKSYGKHTKSPETIKISGLKVGAADQIRTGDLILTKDALYLLSYSSITNPF